MDKKLNSCPILNLSDRIRTEKLLRQSREQFKTVFDHVPVAMFLMSGDCKIEKINHTAIKMFSIQPKAYIDKPIDNLIFDHHLPKEAKAACFPHQKHQYDEVEFTNAVGKRYFLRIIATKIKSSYRYPQWILIIEDITLTVEAKQLQQTISQRILQAHEEEKLLISRELHDTISQSLAALKIAIQTGTTQQSLIHLVDQLIQISRTLSQNLRPETLDNLGLIPALKQLAKNIEQQYNTHVVISTNSNHIRPKSEVALQLYRIAQEAILNAAKHSNAQLIQASVITHNHDLKITIQDDGIGFDQKLVASSSQKGHNLGLKIMAERAAHIGADFTIQSKLKFGTKITISCVLE